MSQSPRYRLGERVWRRSISPLTYGVGYVRAIDVSGGGGEPEYGVVFDQQTTLGLRWLCESELCPILNGSVRSTRGEES